MNEWTDIGQQLREAREQKNLELRDVAHTTRIPLATLEALEESDYSIFPSPTYARSFLAQYSEFLDVDAHDWIDAFETGDVLSNVNDHGYLQESHDHIGSSTPAPGPARREKSARSQREEKSSSGSGTSILQAFTVFFVTAALIAGGIYAYKKYEPMLAGSQEDNPEETIPSDDPAEPDPDQNTTASSNNTDTGSENPPTTAKPDPDPTVAHQPKPDTPAIPKPRTGPPPKALIIDEDEE